MLMVIFLNKNKFFFKSSQPLIFEIYDKNLGKAFGIILRHLVSTHVIKKNPNQIVVKIAKAVCLFFSSYPNKS
jgi:hypothetical protein